jgi:hypothetical protein
LESPGRRLRVRGMASVTTKQVAVQPARACDRLRKRSDCCPPAAAFRACLQTLDLWAAAAEGRTAELARLVAAGADVNAKSTYDYDVSERPRGWLAGCLHPVVAPCRAAAVIRWLDTGGLTVVEQRPALQKAAAMGHTATCTELVLLGAQLTTTGVASSTALHCSCMLVQLMSTLACAVRMQCPPLGCHGWSHRHGRRAGAAGSAAERNG